MDSSSKHHIAILSCPGMGHFIPTLLLGNRLAGHHNLKVTILVITTSFSPSASELLKFSAGEEKLVEIVEIPPVDISHLIDSTTKVVTQIFVMVREALPGIKATLATLKHRPDALIVDLFGTAAFSIAEEFNMSKYVYVTSTAWFTALTVYCQVLDKEIEGEYVDKTEPFEIPGCKPVRPEDVVDPMLDRNDQQYREYVKQGIEFCLSDGILVNTWEELDPISLKALRENEKFRAIMKVPVYSVGPLSRHVEPVSSKCTEIIEWLDMQPSDSVMYVSFGSGGTLTAQQITELAYGLEMSHQRFIWVVRPPVDGGTDGAFFTSRKSNLDGTPDYLPEGFVTRTGKVGIVVSTWVQQVEILNHPSVGGFLSHCGWNSILESIGAGVPMIAWPLYAEQRLNATIITEELGVAVRPEVLPTKKVVDRGEIEKLVRRIMEDKEEGKAMRENIRKLKASGENALRKGGSSYNSVCEVLNDIEMRIH